MDPLYTYENGHAAYPSDNMATTFMVDASLSHIPVEGGTHSRTLSTDDKGEYDNNTTDSERGHKRSYEEFQDEVNSNDEVEASPRKKSKKKVNYNPWTEDEMLLLRNAVDVHGENFQVIVDSVPEFKDRSIISIMSKWRRIKVLDDKAAGEEAVTDVAMEGAVMEEGEVGVKTRSKGVKLSPTLLPVAYAPDALSGLFTIIEGIEKTEDSIESLNTTTLMTTPPTPPAITSPGPLNLTLNPESIFATPSRSRGLTYSGEDGDVSYEGSYELSPVPHANTAMRVINNWTEVSVAFSH